MGCHTWFYRPVTEDEFLKIKNYAPTEIYELTGNSQKNIENGMYDKWLYDCLMESYKENIPCVYGYYWWQLGYGTSCISNGSYKATDNKLYIEVSEYYDIFRVFNYPQKIIRSRRDLRRFLRKRYFELTDRQLEKISEFFREYPGGVITFG